MGLLLPIGFWLFVLQVYCIQQTASQAASSILLNALSMNSVTTLSVTSSPLSLSSTQVIAPNRTVTARNRTSKFLIPTTVRTESKSTSSHLIVQPSSAATTSSMSPYNYSSTPPIRGTQFKPRPPGATKLSGFGIAMISIAGILIVGLVVALIWMRRNREGADGPRPDVKMKSWGKGGRCPKPPEACTSDLDQSEVMEQPTRNTLTDHPLSRSNPDLSNGSFDRESSGNNNTVRTPEGTWRESKMI